MKGSYLKLIENMADGYALFDTLLDAKGEPYDYRYLEVNAAYEGMTGVKRDQLIGRTLVEVFPDVEPHWLDALRKVAVTGRAVRLEQYSQSIDLYLAITASSPEPGVTAVFLTDITERRRAEDALVKSEARLKQAQRLAHIGSWELNLVDNVLIWSDEIYRIFEMDPAKWGASYEAFLETIHPDDRAAVDFAYTNSLKTRTPYAIDHRLRFPDGRIKYVHEQCETFYENDRPVRSLGTVQDITEIRRAERALVENETRLRMYKGLPVPTYTWRRQDEEFILVEYNHAADEASGGKVHDMLGRKVRELYPGQFRLLQDMLCCIDGESPLRREARFPVHPSTEERDFIVTCVALPPDLVMVHMEDITERRRAEEKLRQAAIVFESTLEGAIITDAEGKISAVNKSFSDITGYAPNEALGKNPSFLRSSRHNVEFFRQLWISLQQTGKWQGEIWNRRKTGEIFPTWQNISAVKDESNRTVNYISVFSDITDRRRAEEELNKAQKLESLGLLAGGIAHDFNNLLTAIFGNVSLARLYAEDKRAENAEVIDALTQAESAFKRARDLAQQLLTFSKGGAPMRKTMSLGDLIQEVVTFSIRGSGMRAEFLIDPHLWHANLDEGQIGQAINNLVINAMQAGATLLRIEAKNVFMNSAETHALPPGRYLQLRLQDNGSGIPAEHLAKLFDPYFTTKPGGTGLGLPTTYSIVKRHLGNVVVDSVSGHGTRFTIYLPASDEPVSLAVDELESVTDRTSAHNRALLMDDEASVREVGSALLEKLGYEVELARDGEEAVRLFEAALWSEKPFSVVILDLTVPGGMGGKECLNRLRALDPRIKALVSSGYFNDPVMAQHEQYGFQGRVPKPYRLIDLSQALAAVEEAPLAPAVNT